VPPKGPRRNASEGFLPPQSAPLTRFYAGSRQAARSTLRLPAAVFRRCFEAGLPLQGERERFECHQVLASVTTITPCKEARFRVRVNASQLGNR
jgi:hypothetical protein